MKRIMMLIFLLGLSGCAFVSQDFNEGEYKDLTYGMTKDEVVKALGTAQKESKVTIGGKQYEAWEYPIIEPQKIKYNRLGYNYYKVFFLEGKVERWDKDKVYAQPEFEFRESAAPEQKIVIKEIIKTEITKTAAPETKAPEPQENLK